MEAQIKHQILAHIPLLQEKHELCVNSIAKQAHDNIKEV
jgi:hypothetical protein